jgi:hypothetical protein
MIQCLSTKHASTGHHNFYFYIHNGGSGLNVILIGGMRKEEEVGHFGRDLDVDG